MALLILLSLIVVIVMFEWYKIIDFKNRLERSIYQA